MVFRGRITFLTRWWIWTSSAGWIKPSEYWEAQGNYNNDNTFSLGSTCNVHTNLVFLFLLFYFRKKKSWSSELKPALCCFILSFLQKVFPPVSKLDPSIYGSVESAFKEEHIIGHIDGMSIQQVQKMFVFPFRPSSMEVAIHNMFFLCFQILGTGREQVVHTGLSWYFPAILGPD